MKAIRNSKEVLKNNRKAINKMVKSTTGSMIRCFFLPLLIIGTWGLTPLNACELCESRQPALWRGITHGPGPDGNLDHIITWSAVVIVGITLFFSLKFLIKPKEDQAGHIKNIVINK